MSDLSKGRVMMIKDSFVIVALRVRGTNQRVLGIAWAAQVTRYTGNSLLVIRTA
jgi:hypothetical protein